jgi:hypothetical protein
LSVRTFIQPSFHPPFLCPYARPFAFSPILPQPVRPSSRLFTHLSSVSASNHPPFHPSFLRLYVHPSTISPVLPLSVLPSICIFTRPSSVCAFTHPPFHPSYLRLCFHPSAFSSVLFPSVLPSICLFARPSSNTFTILYTSDFLWLRGTNRASSVSHLLKLGRSDHVCET